MNRKQKPAMQLVFRAIGVASARHLSYPRSLLLVIFGILATNSENAYAQIYLPAIGGSGGAQFKAPCDNQNLTGFELRVGEDVDAIRPVCVTSSGPREISAPQLTTGSGVIASVNVFEQPKVAPGWYGGPGGHIERLLCPQGTPIVIGMDVAAEGIHTISVNNIHLFCGQAVAEQTPDIYPSAIFDAPGARPSEGTFGLGSEDPQVRTGSQRCPEGQVAVGLHGRSGVWLDAMGLICDAPRVTHYVALGRVQTTTSGPPRPICEVARDARARNSPAAPALQAQCESSHRAAPPPPPIALGRVNAGPTRVLLRTPPSSVLAPAPAAGQQPAAPPAQAPPVAPPEKFAPVAAPNDLVIGRMRFLQGESFIQDAQIGVPVAIDCTYYVNAVPNPFTHVHPWQGSVQVGGAAPQSFPFAGSTDAGQHVTRVMWTPMAVGPVSIGCVLNPEYSDAEANRSNNRWDQTVLVIIQAAAGAQ